MPARSRSTRLISAAFVAASALVCSAAMPAFASGAADEQSRADARASLFTRTATYPVFENVPEGVDPADETVAEISAVSDDGKTLVYTDAASGRIGFVDLTDPSAPQGLGTVSLADLGSEDDSPTSVEVVGKYVLVAIDESAGDFVNPKGRLDVLRLKDRTRVASFDLGGQPDSIAISDDGRFAAIAIENQRDEEIEVDGVEGGLPQAPGGFVQIVALKGTPTKWAPKRVAFDGRWAQFLFERAGLTSPEDPEVEYVSFSPDGLLAVTLQENNGIVVIEPYTRLVVRAFTGGAVTASGFDVVEDKVIDASATLTDVPREPDAIGWVDRRRVATANEGDLFGGSRGWTVFDVITGKPVWDAGDTFEQIAIRHGLHNNDRAANKGTEPEGLAIAEFDGTTYAFVASERSNFVAVYDVSDPRNPVFVQTLFSTNGPEGILPIPSRDLLVVSSETDDAEVGVRASVTVYEFGADAASENPLAAAQPSIVSDDVNGRAIGWLALGALSADPADPGTIFAASDNALKPSTIFSVDVTQTPARITDTLVVTAGGAPAAYDVEGLFARPQGGYWLANEGATGAANALIRTDAAGAVVETVALPADITAKIGKWGLEGVTATTDVSGAEIVWVALQRPLWNDPAAATGAVDGEGVTRIGRYDTTTGEWSWFGYQLEQTDVAGDWLGLSEIVAVDDDTLAVIERDKLNGTKAEVKRVYTVDVPAGAGLAGLGTPAELPVLPKSLAIDVLPSLQATNGWTQEKLEGLTIGADGEVYAVTDNDGLKDATGETVFLRLGNAADLF